MRILLFSLYLFSFTGFAQSFSLPGEMATANQLDSAEDRINYYSSLFLGTNYSGGPLGEGENGLYDQDPLYSFSSFDCTTFVETVVALSLSMTEADFNHNLQEIRYKNGVIRYTERNHFISTDWIYNNSQLFKDITNDVSLDQTKLAKTTINKRSWYQFKKNSDLNLRGGLTPEERQQRLVQFRSEGESLENIDIETPYVPLSRLFLGDLVNLNMIQRIPHGSIISMVRPDWNLRGAIGTNLNISHQGLAIKKNGKLYLRHASTKGSVREELFVDYFRNYINSKTLKGFNVLQLN